MMSQGVNCAPRDGQEGTEDGEHEAARLSGRPPERSLGEAWGEEDKPHGRLGKDIHLRTLQGQ